MEKNRAIKDLWIALFAIAGSMLIIFSPNFNIKTILLTIGIIFVVIAIIISLSKGWKIK